MTLAREGKLSIMQGWDLDYQCLPTNDGKGLIFALGVGCSACFTPEEWHSLLDEVYASNPVYSARPEDIVAIPYEDEDGWTCVRFELKENSQQTSREDVMDMYITQGTSSMHHPSKPVLKFSDQTVWVVAAETKRVFDEFEYSYLPVLWPTFGVYASEKDAERGAWGYYSREQDRANENFEVELEDCGSNFIKIRHTDKRYGGYAIYTLSWTKENIRTYE